MRESAIKFFHQISGSGDALQLLCLCFLWFTALVILFSVVYKFLEYYEGAGSRGKLDTKRHRIETFSMAFIILIVFNILQMGFGALRFDFTTRLLASIYGGVLAVAGTILHLWSKQTIGRYWSNQIEIIEGHTIITTGPYAIVRHPMYSSLILWLIGLGLMFLNYAAIGVTVLVFVPMMIIRATAEDRLLQGIDKTSFGVYSRSVSQLVPRFDGPTSLLLRLLVIAMLGYSLVMMQITTGRFVILFLAHLITGIILRVPKISFSYINKSFIMLLIFISMVFFKPAFWLFYIVLIFDIWGLFFDCPCMMIYKRYNRCPCFDLVKGCILKNKT
jgi:protein-S-isoprenylcysteine O-methyltransferase Ste14